MDDTTFRLLQAAWNAAGYIGLFFIGSGLVSFLGFKFFSAKWLENRFQERMESFKHAQQREIEALKFRINTLVDRRSRIYLKEFEFLPGVWFDAVSAYRSTQPLLGLLRQIPNLDGMTPERLESFLRDQSFPDWQCREIIEADNKVERWIKIEDWRLYQKAHHDHSTLRRNLGSDSIFFSEELRARFEELADMIWEVIVEYEIFYLDKSPDVAIDRSKRSLMRQEGDGRLRALERVVRERLWNAEHADV